MADKALKTPATADVTELLLAWSAGDELALEQLVPLVYQELHRMLSTTLHDDLAISTGPTSELTAIDDALKALESIDARKARVVE